MINTALVGFGLAGKVFHAPSVSVIESLCLKKIVSSRKKDIKVLYPNIDVVESIDEVLGEDIDLIIIATPNHMHYQQCRRAILAGKHVVVDKPFTVTFKEASELVELAKEKSVKLSVFHNRRFDGDFLSVKELINGGKLGNINYFESNFNRFRPVVNLDKWRETTDAAGGIFYDLAPHLIDQAVNLFGPPIKVLCDIDKIRKNAKNDDYFHIILSYEKMRIHLNASMLTKNLRERFLIQGDKGSFAKFGMDPQEEFLKTGVDAEDNYGKLDLASGIEKVEILKGDYSLYYQNIADSILNQTELKVTGQEALFIMKLIEICKESSKSNHWREV